MQARRNVRTEVVEQDGSFRRWWVVWVLLGMLMMVDAGRCRYYKSLAGAGVRAGVAGRRCGS